MRSVAIALGVLVVVAGLALIVAPRVLFLAMLWGGFIAYIVSARRPIQSS